MSVFYCGYNGFGQLFGNSSQIISELTAIPSIRTASSVSCSWSTIAMSVEKGKGVIFSGFINSKPNSFLGQILPRKEVVKQVSASKHYILILSDDGNCWKCSTLNGNIEAIPDFTKAERDKDSEDGNAPSRVVKLCSSDYLNLALTITGSVYTIPSIVGTVGLKVVDVACGNEHCILLTDVGSIFTWGGGSRGQLGHGELEKEESPRKVEAFSELFVQTISCGAWHSAIITYEKDLYTWGWNCNGQLGFSPPTDDDCEPAAKMFRDSSLEPQDNHVNDIEEIEHCNAGGLQCSPLPVETPLNVSTVSCGSRHTVIILEDGTVYGCGSNFYGQLGVSPNVCKMSQNMRPIPLPSQHTKADQVVCGGWGTCVIFRSLLEPL